MDETTYTAKAMQTLNHLAELFEDRLDADVELNGGVLTVTLDDGGQYVINKHNASRQIWVSSPRSGAWRFDPDEASGDWRAAKDPSQTLSALINGELGVAG